MTRAHCRNLCQFPFPDVDNERNCTRRRSSIEVRRVTGPLYRDVRERSRRHTLNKRVPLAGILVDATPWFLARPFD
jgi:hypothetical protein